MSSRALGHYQILAKIGAGGMGEVYRAHDEALDRDVALKLLPADSFSDANARARLLREARTASQLNHPNICTIHEVGEAEGQAYIAMELVEGQPLSARLAAGALPAEEVLRFGLQLAEALGHAHERSVVHRDFKSANVILTPEGRAKVLDFGLAKRVSGEEMDEVTRSQASLTQPGALVGTLAYMPPEQLRGQPADARSDIWALGAVLYEMATGARPFQGQTGFELSSAILNQRPAALPGKVPLELKAVIERCLEKEPAQRYQRAGEVRAALEAIQTGAVVPWEAWRYRLRRRRWLAVAASAMVLLILVAALNFERLRTRFFGGAPRIRSLAVLPLENLSGDPAQDYLASGIHEALITDLSKLGGFRRVTARTSVMRFQKTDKPLAQVARELGVEAVITGSVLRSGDRVQITAHLIHAATEEQLWADRYERDMRDILSLQNEVVSSITRAIKLELTPQEKTRLTAARSVNPAAHEAYLQGRYFAQTFSIEGWAKSLQHYEESLRIDPNYALAYSGIAEWNTNMTFAGMSPPGPLLKRAEEAAMKAFQLDPQIPEAHLAIAYVLMIAKWDWAGAEKEYQRALELNPGSSAAHMNYSILLSALGRHGEAIAEAQAALQRDPLSPLMETNLGWRYEQARQFALAEQQYRKILNMGDQFGPVLANLADVLVATGRSKEAIKEIQKVRPETLPRLALESQLVRAYAASGQKAEAGKILEKIKKEPPGIYASPHLYATIYAALGERDQAFAWLDKAAEEHNPWLIFVRVATPLDPIRSDPRFTALLRRMNLPE